MLGLAFDDNCPLLRLDIRHGFKLAWYLSDCRNFPTCTVDVCPAWPTSEDRGASEGLLIKNYVKLLMFVPILVGLWLRSKHHEISKIYLHEGLVSQSNIEYPNSRIDSRQERQLPWDF
ncbi:hypothetical protein RF11_07171 [Thelohanellus kitauei]|uniref:Uncharacterized protein n=1 Tax=Thelohanellus kitauei TaxID=669202 RepID=A0A0C2JXL9_THEKT|nr:hypothetical protein RF11_07171 [Thelohanellus kitauei]